MVAQKEMPTTAVEVVLVVHDLEENNLYAVCVAVSECGPLTTFGQLHYWGHIVSTL